MTKRLRNLLRGNRGSAAVEFAIVAPVLILLLVGIAQIGVLFMANAGLRNAVAEGARFATIHPRPTNEQIIAKVNASDFGLKPEYLTAPTVSAGVDANANYVEVTASYSVPLDFIFYKPPPVVLTETRRAYVHATPS